MRRLRQRRKADLMVVPVPVTNDVIAVLIDRLWLAESVSEDRQQTGLAIADLLHYLLTRDVLIARPLPALF